MCMCVCVCVCVLSMYKHVIELRRELNTHTHTHTHIYIDTHAHIQTCAMIEIRTVNAFLYMPPSLRVCTRMRFFFDLHNVAEPRGTLTRIQNPGADPHRK